MKTIATRIAHQRYPHVAHLVALALCLIRTPLSLATPPDACDMAGAGFPRFATNTVLSETFEGSFPSDNNWTVADGNPTGTPAYWTDVNSLFGNEQTHGGAYKGYCAGFGYGGTAASPWYRDSMAAYMKRPIDLTGASSASLTFWYKIPGIDGGQDHCRVYIDEVLVWDRSQMQTSWTNVTINLTSYAGSSRELKFQFDSGTSRTNEGWYLDDILVTKEAPPDQADLELTGLSVSPTKLTTNRFTSCAFWIRNNGPAPLASEPVTVEYYLSANAIFGDADDIKIGDTDLTVTTDASSSYRVSLSQTGLDNMTRMWSANVAAGYYYVYACVSLVDPPPTDPVPANNHVRMSSKIYYNPSIEADLALTRLSVQPMILISNRFTACWLTIVNNGFYALASEQVIVECYLSANAIFGDADDIKTGDTEFPVTINVGSSYKVPLSQTDLDSMVRMWPGSVAAGYYYVFARVSLVNPPPTDPIAANNYTGTSSMIYYSRSGQPSIYVDAPEWQYTDGKNSDMLKTKKPRGMTTNDLVRPHLAQYLAQGYQIGIKNNSDGTWSHGPYSVYQQKNSGKWVLALKGNCKIVYIEKSNKQGQYTTKLSYKIDGFDMPADRAICVAQPAKRVSSEGD